MEKKYCKGCGQEMVREDYKHGDGTTEQKLVCITSGCKGSMTKEDKKKASDAVTEHLKEMDKRYIDKEEFERKWGK
jgi:hypothetical protein